MSADSTGIYYHDVITASGRGETERNKRRQERVAGQRGGRVAGAVNEGKPAVNEGKPWTRHADAYELDRGFADPRNPGPPGRKALDLAPASRCHDSASSPSRCRASREKWLAMSMLTAAW
jgi:hypothetical protein